MINIINYLYIHIWISSIAILLSLFELPVEVPQRAFATLRGFRALGDLTPPERTPIIRITEETQLTFPFPPQPELRPDRPKSPRQSREEEATCEKPVKTLGDVQFLVCTMLIFQNGFYGFGPLSPSIQSYAKILIWVGMRS